MSIVLHTNRLLLRPFKGSDAQNMYDLNNCAEALLYTGDQPFPSEQAATDFLKSYIHSQPKGYGRFAVIHQKDQNFIGWCGLNKNEEGLVDIGFRLFPKYWNYGYATEAGKEVLTYGFHQLQLKEVIARSHKQNIASIKALHKLGLKLWKTGTYTGIPECLFYRISSNRFKQLKEN